MMLPNFKMKNNNNVAKSLSSNFSSSRQDRKKLNIYSESALKTTLKNVFKNAQETFLTIANFVLI